VTKLRRGGSRCLGGIARKTCEGSKLGKQVNGGYLIFLISQTGDKKMEGDLISREAGFTIPQVETKRLRGEEKRGALLGRLRTEAMAWVKTGGRVLLFWSMVMCTGGGRGGKRSLSPHVKSLAAADKKGVTPGLPRGGDILGQTEWCYPCSKGVSVYVPTNC